MEVADHAWGAYDVVDIRTNLARNAGNIEASSDPAAEDRKADSLDEASGETGMSHHAVSEEAA